MKNEAGASESRQGRAPFVVQVVAGIPVWAWCAAAIRAVVGEGTPVLAALAGAMDHKGTGTRTESEEIMKRYRLSFSRCPAHPQFAAISLDTDTHGVRLTPGKCCGQWKEVWSSRAMDVQSLRNAAEEMEHAADVLESQR